MTDLQKASLWKRISAALFDFILLAIIVAGAATGLTAVFGYDDYAEQVTTAYQQYGEEYGIELPLSNEKYEAMTDAEKESYRQQYQLVQQAMSKDASLMRAVNMTNHLPLLTVTFSVLFGVLLMELLVPYMLGNGQTLGKKIFGIALMRVDGVKISRLQMFVRSVLGKYAVELMIPIFLFINLYWFGSISIVGIAVLVVLLIAQVLCLAVAKNGALLHDVLAGTVAVDFASQMIFETKEEQLEYIKELHAKEAARAAY